MPVRERSFTDPLPAQLYLDTDILVAGLSEVEPHHDRCQRFLQRIAAFGTTELFVSSLTWLEFSHAVTKAQFRARLPIDWQQRFALFHWRDKAVRQRYLEYQLGTLQALLDQFQWFELSLTRDIRSAAINLIPAYNLRSYDSVHVASALSAGVVDLASLDDAFRAVDGLVLWNDLIHGS